MENKNKIPSMNHARKKGQLAFMQSAVVQLAIVFLIVAMVAILLQQFRDTQTNGSYAYNITNTGLTANVTFSNFFSVLVIIVVFVVIIGLIFYVLGGRSKRSA